MTTFISRLLNRRGTAVADPFRRTMSHRRDDLVKWWTYYHGADPESGESQWAYLYRRFAAMPRREIETIENHVRICTDRLRRLLVNSWRGLEFDDPETGRAVGDVFRRNRWPHLLNLAALTAKVTGDAFVRIVPAGPDSPFAPLRLVLLDSETVEIETAPHDRDDLRSVTVAYDYLDRESPDGGLERHRYREIIDRRSVAAFVDGEFAPDFSRDHNLGFVPVVQIKNGDTGGGVYGESYVARLADAQDGVNLLAADLVDIVRYDGHKTTIFQNVAIDAAASRDGRTSGEIDLSIGKGLVVRGEGRVYKLDQQHDLGAALEEYDRKLDAFYALAGVPRLTGDMVSRLGNLSGRAIERLYQDAIESTRESQLLFGEAIADLARKVTVMLGLEPCGVRTLWNTDVITPDIESLAREYDLGARSLRSVMRKLGVEDPERMLAEIAEERGSDALSVTSGASGPSGTPGASGTPAPSAGTPAAQASAPDGDEPD